MDPASSLSVQLDVGGRRCVVVGAGPVGERRARTLVAAGARVVVVAPEATESVRALADLGRLELVGREVRPSDLDGALLVVAATGVPAVDDEVGAAAARRGALVNRADRASRGDLAFPAVLRRGPVSIAVSTGGGAPAVSRLVAEALDGVVDRAVGLDGDQLSTLVAVVQEVRGELAAAGPHDRGTDGVGKGPLDWRSALDRSILDLIRQGRRAEAKERLLACLSSS